MIPTLIYCADGNKRFAEIAIRHGYRYGAQLPNTIYAAPYFIDQDWRNPNRVRYMEALAKYRPALASVLDWEREEQLSEVISWAEEAAQYASEAVIIIPKVHSGISRLPRMINGKQVRLGFSVPTKFAGTQVMVMEFGGWPVHLLGGSPEKQMELGRYLNIQSADGNYSARLARQFGKFFTHVPMLGSEERRWSHLKTIGLNHIRDGYYRAFELSCINIRNAWNDAPCAIRYAGLNDCSAIKAIANQYKQELGFVNRAALGGASLNAELYIAEAHGHIAGFVRWHSRRDGWHTIYEIASARQFRGIGVGRALLNAVPRPLRLKCTEDNPANDWYARQGMTLIRTEPGRKRTLNVWEKSEW
jgi:GNAT superfamily N-acetyltransferase